MLNKDIPKAITTKNNKILLLTSFSKIIHPFYKAAIAVKVIVAPFCPEDSSLGTLMFMSM